MRTGARLSTVVSLGVALVLAMMPMAQAAGPSPMPLRLAPSLGDLGPKSPSELYARARAVAAAEGAVALTCTDRQTDINYASIGELTALPGINNRNIAEAVINGRPWIDVRHLRAVPGIDQPQIDKVSAAGVCFTPMLNEQGAPVFRDACKAGQLNINDPRSWGDLRIPQPVQARLKAIIPVFSLYHAQAVPGIGPGWPGRDLACVVPPDVVGQNALGEVKLWSWISKSGGGTAEIGPAALIVPPSVVAADQWASVTERNLARFEPTTVNLSLYGTWAGAVGVRLPKDPFASRMGWQQTMLHWASGGYDKTLGEVIWGDALTQGQAGGVPTVQATVTSLSDFSASSSPLAPLNASTGGITSAGDYFNVIGSSFGFRTENRCDNPLAVQFSNGWTAGTDAPTTSLGQPLNWCVTQVSPGSFVWSFVNNTSLVIDIGLDTSDGASASLDGPIAGGLLSGAASTVFSALEPRDHREVVAPGSSVAVAMSGVNAEKVFWDFNAVTHGTETLVYHAINIVIGKLFSAASIQAEGADLLPATVECIFNIYRGRGTFTQTDTVYGCFGPLLAGVAVNIAGEVASALARLDIYITAGVTGFDVGRLVFAQFIGRNVYGLSTKSPTRPTQDGQGRPLYAACASFNGLEWVIDYACQDASVLPPPTTGGTSPEDPKRPTPIACKEYASYPDENGDRVEVLIECSGFGFVAISWRCVRDGFFGADVDPRQQIFNEKYPQDDGLIRYPLLCDPGGWEIQLYTIERSSPYD